MPEKRSQTGFFILLLCFLTLLAADFRWGLFEWIDWRAHDVMVRQLKRAPADSDIVIINVDQKSLEAMLDSAGKWSWPRSVHAELVAGLAKQQPKAIVFDILFNEADTFRPDSDAYFRQVMSAVPFTYFPIALLPDGKPFPFKLLPEAMKIRPLSFSTKEVGAPLLLPIILPPQDWRTGLVNFIEDTDGVGRRYWVHQTIKGWTIPSLPVRLAEDKGWKIPANLSMMRLNWRATYHQQLSYSDVYEDLNRQMPKRPPAEFKDKIIIIGTAAPGMFDLRVTPIDATYPGVEILATAIDNLKKGDWLHEVPRWYGLLPALFGLVCLWGAFQQKIRLAWIGTGLAVFSLVWLLSALFLHQKGWVLPFAVSLLSLWGYFWLSALIAFFQAHQEREATITLFNRFLDPRVVKDLVSTGVLDKQQAGENREITVLFSDIRGFTSLSEKHSPEFIVNLLNRYFSMQVEIIFRHGGTLDKFIGDAIMAFWGAPAEDPHHARHAIQAALEMQTALLQFQEELQAMGTAFEIGIGIHSGHAVVGFIGSNERLDYTAIGDTVNLASRIEGQTKGVARVLVSSATRDACAMDYHFVSKGIFHVKGREEGVVLYEPHRFE